MEIIQDASFTARRLPFAALEIFYPEPQQWDMAGFAALRQRELAALREELRDYDRKSVFGENPWYRYFKSYKKSYPVMMQLESWLLKGRPFPETLPLNQPVFLTELRCRQLLGAHDAQRCEGALTLFCPGEKLPFPGLRGEEAHVYPGDVSGRDERDILFSLIGGADSRTCLKAASRHLFHPIFGVPGCRAEELCRAGELLERYVLTLAPTARTVFTLL